MARYRGAGNTDAADARLRAPTFERNSPPIIAQLAPWMVGRSGPALEIGAGTGQHAATLQLAFQHLDWWPSEPDRVHCASISAWREHLKLPPRNPIELDAASDWPGNNAIRQLGPLSVIISMNVIHISPFSVTSGIIAGAGKTLMRGGLLIFYGPFLENGKHTGTGNATFDKGLRAENPDWGVRDIDEISQLSKEAGLKISDLIQMPANNRLLIYGKT